MTAGRRVALAAIPIRRESE